MARLKVVLAALVILPSFVAGQQSPLNHTVVRGETLWGLAQRYYQDSFLWTRIWEANRAGVADPHWIYPTQVLVIPGREGAAVIGAVDVRPGQQPGMGDPEPEPEPEGDPRTRNRTVFYRDPDTGVGVARTEETPRYAVPRHTVYSSEWLVTDDNVRSIVIAGRPRLVADELLGTIDALVGAGELRTALPYTRVRVTLDGNQSLAIGDRLQSFRPGRVVEGIGRVMIPTSVLTVTGVEEAGVVAVVLDAFDRVRGGDMVRPAPAFELQLGDAPTAIIAGGTAHILGFGEYHAIQNMGDIAFLDRGEAQGVKVGDEYILYSGDTEGWMGEVAGRLQVVGMRANTASARIVNIVSPVFVAGVTVHLDRKMR